VRRRSFAAVALALACVAALAAVPLPVSAHVNDVRADPQLSADGTVTVETAYVAGDAWLALYADDDGSRGELIGTERLSGAGFRTDYAATIDDDAWSDWSAGEARRVHVALHNDKGSSGFDREEDNVLTFFGREAATTFTLERGPTAYVGTRAFSPQATDDPTVRVRSVTLPADGHLVVRNVTAPGTDNETAAEPVGATALDAGSHANVTVRLNESYYERLGPRPRVAFTLYADDGDGRFGAGDDPVRAGEDSVTTFLFLNRTDVGGGGSDGGTGSDTSGGSVVTTATVTADGGSSGDGGSVVTTATPTAATTDTPTTASSDGSGATDGETGSDGGGGTTGTSTDGQPGFGPAAALVGLLAAVALAAGRRCRRT
jgi:PGF-CTERM protein